MKIRKNDKVKILTGKDAGKEGKVLAILTDTNKVVVSGIGVVKRHVKPGAVSKEGGIIKIEKPIAVSNVMLVCEKCNKPTRVAFSEVGDKKFRVCKKCGEVFAK
ncbi:TPA: 50S ribosomal protein L24 [candidate division WWE3 bacterium]|uniref:Large ribosomal subunit protein uL24 n=5 Tax=Katanobacteria TaxID=422282 RepID=A0A0G1KN94_UNCKA|nr:MAG: 50S ribosomal protein L24 [candidate division WWE3 bacterium GW2011_GWA2_44_16]KKT70152.1 MAG: 50S ribosomal protein L24 [candidate division WWE3 bacterium GW2011_GWB1_44_4]KKT85008.1 MAG: 50S ribosomal protein L24 [candidate division WWE3 bacterium GW2011_GWC2_44_9]OGC52240.1 MAG: 50S ribosomal protein L24 [candidate division WWE3 bacterium RIFCSPHIGHO2_01_FULL_43_9]HAZ29308.1 50S ribosomal protein L24 [candidate division WWE3 bacterium]